MFVTQQISDDHLQSMKEDLTNLLHKDILTLPHDALTPIPSNYVIDLLKKLGINEADFITQYSQSPTADPQFFLNLVSQVHEYQTARPKYLAQVYGMEHTAPQLKAKILYEFATQIGYGNQNFHNLLPKEEIIGGLNAMLSDEDSFLKNLGLEKKDVFSELVKFMNLNLEG